MRYDTLVTVFDEKKEYIDEILANVTDIGTEKQNQLFGNLKEDRKCVRLRNFETFRSGFMEFDSKMYRILKKTTKSKSDVFYVGEYR